MQPEQQPPTTTMTQDYSVKALFPILDTKRGNSSSQLAEVLPYNRSSLSPLRLLGDIICNEKKIVYSMKEKYATSKS
ncbi:hypothetical protein CFP56_020667 [Quercus suber]|uniref:Uncharacterized protein n=1 Tax=Quercus suber TaxID=58331 RepID=A0AAW0KIM1_QUESU